MIAHPESGPAQDCPEITSVLININTIELNKCNRSFHD